MAYFLLQQDVNNSCREDRNVGQDRTYRPHVGASDTTVNPKRRRSLGSVFLFFLNFMISELMCKFTT